MSSMRCVMVKPPPKRVRMVGWLVGWLVIDWEVTSLVWPLGCFLNAAAVGAVQAEGSAWTKRSITWERTHMVWMGGEPAFLVQPHSPMLTADASTAEAARACAGVWGTRPPPASAIPPTAVRPDTCGQMYVVESKVIRTGRPASLSGPSENVEEAATHRIGDAHQGRVEGGAHTPHCERRRGRVHWSTRARAASMRPPFCSLPSRVYANQLVPTRLVACQRGQAELGEHGAEGSGGRGGAHGQQGCRAGRGGRGF